MNFFLKYLFICIFIFPIAVNAFGQVHADFSASTVKGCAPLHVDFKNNSTGSGNMTYKWIFGNGNSSTDINPSANYINSGIYTVTLIVSNVISTDTLTKTNYITVYKNPTANFTGVAPLSGCTPLNISFNDLSIPGDGAINQWQWDFGDSYGATAQNTSHNYSTPGTYTVSLQVVDVHGCKNDKTIPSYIIASTKPVVNFSANATTSCTIPFSVTFTNSTTGNGPMSYAWSFGDGGTSTNTSPNHIYNIAGIYTVTLVATDHNGCSNTLVKTNYISITPVTAAFHSTPSDSACQNQIVNFFNDATGTTSVLWNFGDPASGANNTSNLSNPTHSYLQPGQYIITMTAAPGSPCQAIIKDTIIIRQPPIVFFSISPTPHYICDSNMQVNFTDQSPDAVSWSWVLGDGNISSLQNPSATYNSEGSYNASLTIVDSHGCIGKHTDPIPIIVDFPSASFSFDGEENHCVPYKLTFTDESSCNTTYDNITAWSWDFDDGGTSNVQNPVYIILPGNIRLLLI